MAAPVFKEIADKVFATNLDIHRGVNVSGAGELSKVMPVIRNGNQNAIRQVAAAFHIPLSKPEEGSSEWVTTSGHTGVVTLTSGKIDEQLKSGTVPNLSGMLAKDALYLLENNGLKVKLNGSGVVASQSLAAGAKYQKDSQITLELL